MRGYVGAYMWAVIIGVDGGSGGGGEAVGYGWGSGGWRGDSHTT